MIRSVLICLAFIALQANGEVAKCDPIIVDKIQTFWAITGTPKGVLTDLEALGKGALVASTLNDHFTTKNLQEPECVYSDITGNKGTYTVVANKELTEKRSVEFEEKDGIIKVLGDGRYIYIVAHGEGTTWYYTCNPAGKEGAPEGAVAVALKKFSEPLTKKLADFGGDLLNILGIQLDVVYSDDCFTSE